MGVDKDFKKLRELMLLEEFNNCLLADIKMYLEEQKLTMLAISSDDYSLTHQSSFGRGTSYEEKCRKLTGPTVDGGPRAWI